MLLHSRLQSFHFVAYLLVIQTWKWHASSPFLLLFLSIPSCSSKEVSIFYLLSSIFLTYTAAFKIGNLSGRLKVEFKSCASANEMFQPAFSCLLTLSFWSCNYSPAVFWSEPNHRWTLRPPLVNLFRFLIKGGKAFVMLCGFYLAWFSHFIHILPFSPSVYLCRGQHFAAWPAIVLCRLSGCCSSLWREGTQGNPPTFEWLPLKLLMRCFYI